MKLNVTRQELDECISNAVAKVLKEYSFDDFDDFSDDDALDSMLDDPELRAALANPKAKKAKKVAKAQGERELAAAQKDDDVASSEDTVDTPDMGDEDYSDEEENTDNQVDVRALMQQAADNETDPLFLKCIKAGIPLSDLYNYKDGSLHKRKIEDVDLEYMAKHPTVGRRVDPMTALDLNFGPQDDADRSIRFKARGGFSREGVKQARSDAEAEGEYFR